MVVGAAHPGARRRGRGGREGRRRRGRRGGRGRRRWRGRKRADLDDGWLREEDDDVEVGAVNSFQCSGHLGGAHGDGGEEVDGSDGFGRVFGGRRRGGGG